MKLSKEQNAARRAKIWNDLKERFPNANEHELLQTWLDSLEISYTKRKHLFVLSEEVCIHIPALELHAHYSREVDYGHYTINTIVKPRNLEWFEKVMLGNI